MTDIPGYVNSWIAELVVVANRHSIVFVPMGIAFESIRSTCLAMFPAVLAVDEYLSTARDHLPKPRTIVLTEIEKLCDERPAQMGVLRSRIHEDYEDQRKFVLLSRYPRKRYPELPGSSILLDAKLYLPPLVPNDRQTPQRSYVLPIDEGEGLSREHLVDILREVGIDVVANLDFLLYEAMLGREDLLDELDRLDHQSVEGLRGAGLIQVVNDEYLWTYPEAHNHLRFAVADVIASYTVPPAAISEAFGLVWGIERMIRLSMRARAILASKKPSWQASALTAELSCVVLDRATSEAYSGAKSVNEIRDPLEWLTLGELLDLRQSMASTYGDLGVSSPVWRSFTTEVPAIRNRLSHMRLLQKSDLSTLRKWHTALRRKLPV